VISWSGAIRADVYPDPPYDFANDPFAGRPVLLSPTEGARPLDLLVILIELDGFDYTGRGADYLSRRVFGGGPSHSVPFFFGNTLEEYFRRASHGRVELRRAAETSGIVNDGIVIVDGGAAASEELTGIEWRRRALDLADPYVDYAEYDSNDDGTLSSSEMLIIALIGNDLPGGQVGGIDDSSRELDGIAFEGYALVLTSGPTGEFLTWAHELMHLAYEHKDLYGFTIGSWDIMGPTVGISAETRWGASAFTKLLLGWTPPTVVDRDGWYRLHRADAHEDMLLLYAPTRGTDEYFLVQNRIAGDASIDRDGPDSGILIQRIDLSLWLTTHDSEPPVETLRPDGVRNVPGCQDTSVLTSDANSGVSRFFVDRYRFPAVGPFTVLLHRDGESDLEEIVPILGATDRSLGTVLPLRATHPAGTKVTWRVNNWSTSYFATELAADADEGDTTLSVGTIVGTIPLTPFEAVLGIGDAAITLDVIDVDGTTWTFEEPLEADYASGTRVAAPWRNSCFGGTNTDAWEATILGPASFDATWADGEDARIHLYGIAPAAETTEMYVDVPSDGAGLYLESPLVHRIVNPTLPTPLRWLGRNTGGADDSFRLIARQLDGREWGNRVLAIAAGAQGDFNLILTPVSAVDPPWGLTLYYEASSLADPSVVHFGEFPVDWPFPAETTTLPYAMTDWDATAPDARIFAPRLTNITRATSIVFSGSAPMLTVSPLSDIDEFNLSLPDLATELATTLPPDTPPPTVVPQCGTLEEYLLPGLFGPETLEIQSVLDVRVVPHHGHDPPVDRVDLVGAPRVDGQRLQWRIFCPGTVVDLERLVELELYAFEPRLQRYEYDFEAEYKAQILRVPGQSIYRELAASGDAQSIPCLGGHFPICRPDSFGQVTTPLPPRLRDVGGCPADGCPDHFAFGWELGDALLLELAAPPGTAIALLNAFGAVIAQATPVPTEPQDPIVEYAREHAGPDLAQAAPPAGAALDALAALDAAPELPSPGPRLPPSPFIPDRVPPVKYVLAADKLPGGVYLLQVKIPPSELAPEVETDPVILSFVPIDHDGDGRPPGLDNCPDAFNPDQRDFDGDSIGDACDDDTDGDGVLDGSDSCPSTPLGDPTSPATGCSITQLCPCDGPRGGTTPWRNHGQYVSCVANTAEAFVTAGLIPRSVQETLVSAAAGSSCGR
jgi:M6 family metalloprotease-like protein